VVFQNVEIQLEMHGDIDENMRQELEQQLKKKIQDQFKALNENDDNI
jgi:hypothetical protein